MSAKDDADVTSDTRIDNATVRVVIPVLKLASLSSSPDYRPRPLTGAGSPADGVCAIPRRLAIHRGCADRNDPGRIPSSRTATDVPEFRRGQRFSPGRAPS